MTLTETDPLDTRLAEPGSEWWRTAVIYQIYPRSFSDSSGDGVGDLPGVTSRLDDLAELGVDALWLSPFQRSPQKDAGYDVSDYCDVDPIFGTLADFDEMLAQAHQRSIRIIVDLRPRRSTEDRLPVVGRGAGLLVLRAVAEEVAGALGTPGPGGEGRLEPLVLVGRVVGHQVDHDAQAELVGARDQVVGVVQRRGGERLATVPAAALADHDVGLADDRQVVDARGHPPEHHEPLRQVAGPAADAVERRPGGGDRCAGVLVDGGVPVLVEARVRRPRGCDAMAVGALADRAGEDPQPVGLLARRAAREAGGEGVERVARVRRRGRRGGVRVNRVHLGERPVDAVRRGDRSAAERRGRDAGLGGDIERGVEGRRLAERHLDRRPAAAVVVRRVGLVEGGQCARGPATVAGVGRSAEASGHDELGHRFTVPRRACRSQLPDGTQ